MQRLTHRRELVRVGLALAGLGLIAGCGGLPLPGQRPARVLRIGYLGGGATTAELFEAFRQGLRELGHVEGEGILIEYRFTDGRPGQAPALAAELVGLDPDVIVANGAEASAVAKNATTAIPIVGVPLGADPVGAGLVASLARPGGNVTGLSTLGGGTVAKRLQLLKEVSPSVGRLGVLWNPGVPGKPPEFREVQEAASSLALQILSAEVRRDADFDGAFRALAASPVDALLVLQENLTVAHSPRIAAFAMQLRLPSIQEVRDYTAAGGLMSYGINRLDIWRRGAGYVAKILRGAKPADLPVEQPTMFDLVINLTTARVLGLTIPQAVLQQATVIIE
jgi:putative ABC transport system substrate-binding protein